MRHVVTIAAGLMGLLASIAIAQAGGDPAKGQVVFNKCAICHNFKKGEPNKVGPNLYGLFDRDAGKQAGYDYSPGLAKADFKWDDDKLDKWLQRPQKFIAGAKMPINLPNAQERADVISYLHKAAEGQ